MKLGLNGARCLPITTLFLVAIAVFISSCANASSATPVGSQKPDVACQSAGPKECLGLAIDAMGGAARLQALKSMSYESVSHTLLVEQSYRQDPFIASYERGKSLVDLSHSRIRVETTLTWPESDPGQSESHSAFVASSDACVQKPAPVPGKPTSDLPCSLTLIDWSRELFGIGPMRILTTAQQAPDLHFAPSEILRSTPHTVLAFSWQGMPIRILLNPFNHLPDAVDTEQQFHDHWYQWGDVRRRIYLDNWVTVQGIRYPTNQIEERNGTIWKSTQILEMKLNVPIDALLFEVDAKAAAVGANSKGWERPFDPKQSRDLAPGITFFPGAWNSTLVKQDDGVFVLEAPISGTYSGGVIAEAQRRYPNLPPKGVFSTSDSWPHVGGVRQAVASKLPVYILDLNQPLLDRLIASKRTIKPDLLASNPQKPVWRIVSGKTQVGGGSNRVELYPLRGACTERQYMVYFPEHRLLYASDTLAINDDGSLYDPELVREVMEAVQREDLAVDAVFAMHQPPMAWKDVVALLQKSLN